MANFVNPAYATPAQREAMRKYAAQLMQPSDVRHWTQGVGDIARALVGGTMLGRAGEQERGAKTEYAKQLAEAVRSKDPALIQSVLANPEVEPVQAFILKQLLEAKPSVRYGAGGATYEAPSKSIIESQPDNVPVKRVPTQSYRLAPGGGNLSDQQITGVDVQNAPLSGNQRIAAEHDAASGIPPAATGTLTGLSDLGTKFKTQQDQYDLANKENMAIVAKRPVVEQRAMNIKTLKALSDNLEDPAVIAKLKTRAAELGIPSERLGPYEIFAGIAKQVAYQEMQEASASGRIQPYVYRQFQEGSPQLWNTKAARDQLFNKIYAPLEHDIRRAKIAARGMDQQQDPVTVWKKQTSAAVDPTPLSRPVPNPTQIKQLQTNPSRQKEFDQLFGPNASDEYLGQ
jgi:hypothetical protein